MPRIPTSFSATALCAAMALSRLPAPAAAQQRPTPAGLATPSHPVPRITAPSDAGRRAPLALVAQTSPSDGIGIARFTAVDRVHADTVRVLLWYRSNDPARDTSIALTPLHVAVNGTVADPRQRPLVIISHGTGGNEVGHWDTAEALARAGFIVATVRHAGDNSGDRSALGTDRYLYGRSTQIRAVLDTLLRDRTWAAHIDPRRIGFLGFSVGGLTGLELVGGVPRPERFAAYCARHPTLQEFCSSGLRGHFTLTGAYPAPAYDARIRSAVLWAPAYSFMFDGAALKAVHVPLLIARGTADPFVLEPDDVLHVVPLLRAIGTPVTVRVIRGGAHYTFLAPCSAALAHAVPVICHDPPGIDRVAVHRMLDADAVRFFRTTLR